jgi:hypothetical protein
VTRYEAKANEFDPADAGFNIAFGFEDVILTKEIGSWKANIVTRSQEDQKVK